MTRFVAIILGLITYALVCSGQDSGTNPMTEEMQRLFNLQKMNIETEGYSLGSYGGGGMTATTWRRWTAYEGFTPMTEEHFFLKTGYTAEADKARKYKQSAGAYMGVGVVLALVGTVMALAGASKTKTTHYDYGYGVEGDLEEADPDLGLVIGGGVASTLGLGLALAGAAASNRNWAPYATVSGIADDYNKRLMIKIQTGF
ncbi:hypothetical protein IT157_07195 [bacterium]|nr:hypothetical protein [bacterium]